MAPNPMGEGEDVLAGAQDNNQAPSMGASAAAAAEPTHTNFGILPNGEEEILNQIQALMTLTLQNQKAINKIVGVLEKQGTPVTLPSIRVNNDATVPIDPATANHKGKGPLLRKDSNPFDE
jgi:hypothetical protein